MWNPKFRSRVQNSPPLDPMLRYMNPVHIYMGYLLRLMLVLKCGILKRDMLINFSNGKEDK